MATVGVAVVATGVPAGVDIIVDGIVVGVSDGTDIDLVFDLDGRAEIEITSPFPHKPLKKIIEVSV